MAEKSPKDVEHARQIVEGLLSPDGGIPDINPSLVISDVQADAKKFADELKLLEESDDEAPAIRVGDELVPMALALALASVGPLYPIPALLPGFPGRLHFLLMKAREFGDFETMPRQKARATFAKRASDFLATRMAWVRDFYGRTPENRTGVPFLNILQRVGGVMVQTPGCYFTVTTNSVGLRVFWSGAYVVSSNYFGHPTYPVHSVLQSGDFIFGVDGGAYGSTIRWDRNAKVTLPGNPHVHLNY